MGMFGGIGRALNKPDGGGLSIADRIAIFGAAYDGDQQGVNALRNAPLLRAQKAQQDQFLSSFQQKLGPQYAESAPVQVDTSGLATPGAQAPDPTAGFQLPQRTSNGMDINSPDLARILAAAPAGVQSRLAPVLDVLKAQQPDVRYDRGYGYNGKTGAKMGGYHADLDKGIRPTDDGGAEVLPGYADAAASIEGAKTGAQEKAKAPYNFPTFTGPDGRPITVSAATAAALGSKGGIIAQGPSPAQTEADKLQASAGAQANIDTPRTLGNAAQAISLIEQMKGHAGLDSRTGWRSAIPAIPGTPGADFQAMADQLKGKVFLEAFGSLKGSGQITEVEGKKATDAIGRLSQQQTKDGYLKALQDLEDVINTGAARAAGQAQRLQPAASGGGSTPAAPKRPAVSSIPVADRLAEARRRGLIK